MKLNDYNFIGFTFNSPLAPSIITNKKAEIYLDDFMASRSICKLFAEHNHPSSVGPTGPLMPAFAGKLLQTMSKKVFLG